MVGRIYHQIWESLEHTTCSLTVTLAKTIGGIELLYCAGDLCCTAAVHVLGMVHIIAMYW